MSDQAGRMILNANLGIANTVSKEEFLPIANDLLDNILEILSQFCGPFARFGMIISLSGDNQLGQQVATGTHFDMKIHTKDGIKLLNAIEHVSPIQAYIKSLLSYIGQRVDTVCKDGTTTSILFAARFLKALLSKEYHLGLEIEHKKLRSVDFEQGFVDFTARVVHELEKRKHTLESIKALLGPEATDQEAAACIAWMQAYTSSGGDLELARAVQQVFLNTPRSAWGHVEYIQNSCETNYRYKCDISDWQYTLPGMLVTTQHKNHNNLRDYYEENVILVPLARNIYNGSMEVVALEQFIRETPNRTIVILATEFSGELVEHLTAIGQQVGSKVVLLVHSSIRLARRTSNLDWEILGIAALGGVRCYEYVSDTESQWMDKTLHTLDNVTVQVDVDTIHLNQLYRDTPGRSPIPEDTEGEQRYAQFLKDLDQEIAVMASRHRKNPAEIADLQAIRVNIETPHKIRILVGGRSHDQLAAMDVIEDAIGASISALNRGFYINGVVMLHQALTAISPDKYNFRKLALRATETVLQGIGLTTLECKGCTKYNFLDVAKDTTKRGLKPFLQKLLQQAKQDEMDHKKLLRSGVPPLQSAQLFPELLSRIGELVIRFGLTNLIVVPGTVWQNKRD